jgi:hypothetical protein
MSEGNDAQRFGQGNGKMAQLKYGDHTVDTDAIPDAIKIVLMQRTFSHKMGNEVSAAVVSRCRTAMGNPDATKDAIAEWRTAHASEVEAWESELRSSIVQSILDGTLGVREVGPRKDPVEAKFESLVTAYVRSVLKSGGKKLPKDDETIIDLGNGVTRTRSQMLANARASQGDRLRKEAEKMVRDEQRLADRAEKEGKANGLNVESLGI